MNNWKKTFAIIWGGQFVSLLTSSIVNFAIVIWLSVETRSAEVLAFGTIAALLPQSVLGFFTGVYVDRWNRKRIMIFSDAFIATCTLVLAVLFWRGEASLGLIYVLLGLRSVGSAFHGPAMQASIPLLAPEDQLMRIAGINQTINSVSYMAGPALGALLITLMDIGYVLLFDVVGAAAAITSLLFVKIPNPEHNDTEERHLWREMKEGIREIVYRPGINTLFLFSILVFFCMMPVSVLFPLMTLEHFKGNEFQMSLVEAVWSAGSFLGGLIIGVLKYKGNRLILINCSYLVMGASFLLSGILPASQFVWFVVFSTVGGICGAFYQSAFTSLLQEKIEPGLLGRAFSMFSSFTILPAMIGLLGTGFMADTIGLTATFVILGSIIVGIGIIAFFIRPMMELDRKKNLR